MYLSPENNKYNDIDIVYRDDHLKILLDAGTWNVVLCSEELYATNCCAPFYSEQNLLMSAFSFAKMFLFVTLLVILSQNYQPNITLKHRKLSDSNRFYG